ncbi:hypothetical protein [Ponticaulis sp.]|uniref:hypothetical protein n=1 Tax=Ponticaulis sp. TaxID=2020902 RepID=UPI000B69CE08|nr:hypothetical protein [Ponticaulis sp.]MAJ07613.1 hypothetical protein [Ponticaulis sp.]RPG17841.1 MAG: hypothetical protein CBC85_004665 [Hyphomonadaceae bacterium TMED125]HBH90464.1 hypothetical protein [Hyphomonadaceae bacterium]HBJ92715.1 hypothetical protein [Hyphomonadaceae bacterium]
MSDDESNQLRSRKVGGDDLIEDMFGLNLRGLKTLWVMFVSPRVGYEAARSPDWIDRSYTPSIRLLFSLLAVMTATRFLWAGADSSIHALVDGQVAALEEFGTQEERSAFTEHIIDYFLLLFPFSFMLSQAISGSLLRVWGKGTNTIVRVRLYMLAMLPNATFTLFALPLMTLLTVQQQTEFSLALIALTFLIDFVTVMRGGVVSEKRSGRIIKSALYATASNLTAIISNSLCVMLASIIAGIVIAMPQ